MSRVFISSVGSEFACFAHRADGVDLERMAGDLDTEGQ